MIEKILLFFLIYPQLIWATDCRQDIKKLTCLVDAENKISSSLNRKCQGGEKKYSNQLLAIYDRLPLPLQRLFCSVKKIYIEKNFIASAYARDIENDKGEVIGHILGLSKEKLFDNRPNFQQWLNQKEQLNWGHQFNDPIDIDLPHFKIESSTSFNFLLYFVVAHELGHFLDSMNQMTWVDMNICKNENGKWTEGCEPPFIHPEWMEISWEVSSGDVYPNNKSNFLHIDNLCFYQCHFGKDHYIPTVDQSIELITQWLAGNFPSLYGATVPEDDFAESVAYYALASQFDDFSLDYIYQPGGIRKDILERFKESDKFRFMQSFLYQTIDNPHARKTFK